jgi:zinc D-Ala-D-Ala dipeptidase
MIRFSSCFVLILMVACGSDSSENKRDEMPPAPAPSVVDENQNKASGEKAEEMEESVAPSLPSSPRLNTTAAPGHGKEFSDVTSLDPSIRLDIRYATTDNFTKSKIYDCPLCLLRPEAAEAVVAAHKALKKKGLGLKMFDCYRPRPYQQRLWDKVPNPDYVTPPAKGSMHSRGAAVDLTIVEANGKELDMGTPYDFFGPEAHTDNTKLPQKVLANRRLLRETLEAVGFKGIRTEWWHFSYQRKSWPLSDYVWPCDK